MSVEDRAGVIHLVGRDRVFHGDNSMAAWKNRLLASACLHPPRIVLVLVLLLATAVSLWVALPHWRAEYHFRAGRAALERRALNEAEGHLSEALRVWPRSAPVHFLRARLARLAGHYPEAQRRLEACKRLGYQGEEMALESSLLRAQQGEFNEYVEGYLRTLVNKDHPDTVLILEALARGYMQDYRVQDALACLNLWIELRPDDVQARLGRGWVLERLDQFEKARDDYRRAVELAPDLPEPRLRLGQVLLLIGDLSEALPVLEQAHADQPDNPAAGVALAQCLSRLGRNGEALRLLDKLAGRHPDEGPVLFERGNLTLQARSPHEAEPWLRRAVAQMPFDYQANYSLAQCLFQLGKEPEARTVQARAEELQADLIRMKDLTESLQSRPYDPGLRTQIGELFLRHGEKHQGEVWLKSALRTDPNYRPAHEALARYYEERGETALADQHRSRVGRARPPNRPLLKQALGTSP